MARVCCHPDVGAAFSTLAVAAVLCLWPGAAAAQYQPRASVTTNGGLTFTGNALGLDGDQKENGQGSRGAIGAFITTDPTRQDNSPAPTSVPPFPFGTTSDWRSNSSTARLRLPAGARVVYAELIWGGTPTGSRPEDNVTPFLDDPVVFTTPAATTTVAPDPATAVVSGNITTRGTCTACYYLRTANVTALVAAAGAGSYTVGRVPGTQSTIDNNNNSAGWTLAVVYENAAAPVRSMTLFVGLDKSGGSAAPLSGFCTAPAGPVKARLAVSALDGDARSTGDGLLLGATSDLSNADRLSGPRNPATNFFAGQITDDQGNLDTTGTFGSRNHTPGAPVIGGRQSWDIANVDASGRLTNSQTTAFAGGVSKGDSFQIAALGLQVDVGGPGFADATGAMTVDRATAILGDVLTYSIVLDNSTGTAQASNVTFFDTPPPGTSFVAGSFTVNGTALPSADPAAGVPIGAIAAGTKATVRFQVRVDAIPPGPTPHLRTNRARWTFDFATCAGQPPQGGAAQSNTVVTQVPVADLSVTASAGAHAVAGSPVTGQIVVTNSGPSTAAGALVTTTGTTPLLTNATWTCSVPASGACVPASGTGRVSSTITLPSGFSARFSVTGTVPPFTPAGTLSTTASVTASAAVPDFNVANNSATVSAPVVTWADVAITNTGPGTVTRGGTAVYTIAVTNRGPSDASDVLVLDPAPSGLTLLSFTGACAVSPGCVLPAGGAQTAVATFTVPLDYTGPDPIINVATVGSATSDPIGANNSARATVAVNAPVADLSVSQTDNATQVAAGATTTYVITVSSAGPASAPGTRIVDTFDPATFSSVQWQCVASGTSTCATTGLQSGSIDTLVSVDPGAANAIVLTAQARIRSDATGTAENTATVDAPPTMTDPSPANDAATDIDAIRVVADVSIAVAGPPAVVPGTSVQYVIIVANAGPSTARELNFLEAPEESVAVPEGSAGPELITGIQAPADATCANAAFVSAAGREFIAPRCTIPALPPLATRTFTVRLTIPSDYPLGVAPSALLLRNQLTLDAEVDEDPTSHDRVALTTATIQPQADVSVSTIGPPSVVAGSTASYFIRVANDGPSTARNIVVENPIPPGVTVVSRDGPCAGGFPCTQPVLPPGEDNTTRIDVLVPNDYQGPPTFVETASVRADSGDPVAANDAQSVTTFVVPEQADLSIAVSAPTVVVPGAPRTYVGRVTNLGPGPATDITVADVLPGGATFVGGSAPGAPTTCAIPAAGTSNVISCLTPTLPVDGVLDFSLTVQTAADLVPGAVLTNVGSASSPTPDLRSANDRSVAVTRVASPGDAELLVEITEAADPAIAGGDVTYTVVVTNAGPAVATNVRLADTLPPGFTLVSATPERGACTGASCTLGSLPAAAAAAVTIVATPSATGLFTNVARVEANEPDPVPGNNTVSEPTTVAAAEQADLVIEKSGPTLMAPGEASFYSIRVSNRGPAPAVNIEISDPLPAGFVFIANTGDCVTAFPCEIEQLEAGESRRILTTFSVDPAAAAPAVAVNTATLASTATEDPDPANNSSSLATTVYPSGSADLFVSNLESPTPVLTGAQLSFFLSVGNRGPSDAAGVTLTDVLPSSIHVVAVTSTHGTCTGKVTVNCQLGDMPPGSLARIGILATAPLVVPIPNPMRSTATVASRAPDPDPSNNVAIEPALVVPPIPHNAADLSIALVGPVSVGRGQALTYTLTIHNAGPTAASTVVVDNPVPAGLTFVSASGECVTSFPCILGTVAPGESRAVAVTFAVPAGYDGASPILSTVAVATPTFDPRLANNVAEIRTLVGIDVRGAGCSATRARSVPVAGAGAAPIVSGVPAQVAGFPAYEPGFTGGARVACGDVTGDGVPELITGPGPGGEPLVRVWDLSGGSLAEPTQFFAYAPGFRGGVSVAAGDVTGDGIAEIVTGAGPGGGPHVRVWNLSGGAVVELTGFFAYAVAFGGGVSVALGDLTGDGVAEIVTGAGAGGGPHVQVWGVSRAGITEIASFFAYDAAFAGGVSVAVGDLTGDGVAEIVTGAGPGGGPQVRAWRLNGRGAVGLIDFFAYAPTFGGGVSVAAGDLTGDGIAELVTAAGPGGGPHVRVWSVTAEGMTELAGFFAYDTASAGGASVAVGDLTGDGIAELITGTGRGVADVRIWSFDAARPQERAGFFPFEPAFPGGVSVAVGDVTGEGIADLLTGSGPGAGSQVRRWRITSVGETQRAAFFPFGPAFTGGVSVAVGDVSGDGVADVVTGAGPGGSPHVRVWNAAGSGAPTELASFFAYAPTFRGGVSVAVGDVTGDGVAELITGAGPGGGPHVRVWSLAGGHITELVSFFAFDAAFRGGVSVAAGDLTGDGLAEVVAAAGSGGGPRVGIWDLSGGVVSLIGDFAPYDSPLAAGVSLAVGDLTGDGVAELATGAGSGGSPEVCVWSLNRGAVTALARFAPYDPRFAGGVSLAVGDLDGDGVGEVITGAGPGGGPHVRIWSVSGASFLAQHPVASGPFAIVPFVSRSP